MGEAADLGTTLVQAYRGSIWRCHTPLVVGALLISLGTMEIAPWLPAFVLFWLKPWLDRTLLFVLSRAAFSETTRFADVWDQRATVWWQGLFWTLTWRRLSPWRSYTQPVMQLEGQRGKGLRQRRATILRGQRTAAGAMHFIFANVEFALGMGVFSLALWFAPEGMRRGVFDVFTSDELSLQATTTLLYAGVVLFLVPFYVAAGFAM